MFEVIDWIIEVIFVAPPKGTPVISKIEELFGENNKLFNCTGNPGYPTGNLQFKVKFKDDKDFQDYDFHNINRTNTDRKCIRKQVVKVKYLFSMKWNLAVIRCQAPGSDKYDETNIYLLERKFQILKSKYNVLLYDKTDDGKHRDV